MDVYMGPSSYRRHSVSRSDTLFNKFSSADTNTTRTIFHLRCPITTNYEMPSPGRKLNSQTKNYSKPTRFSSETAIANRRVEITKELEQNVVGE